MALSRRYSVAVLCWLLAMMPVVPACAQGNQSAMDSFLSGTGSISVVDAVQPASTFSQTDSSYKNEDVKKRNVSPSAWDKATKGLDYGQEKKKEKLKDKDKDNSGKDTKPEDETTQDSELHEINNPVIKYIAIGIMLVLLAALVIYLFRSTLFLKNNSIKRSGASLLEDLEENLQESDLDKALREALDSKDYRLALRIYYLAILKEMTLKQWIAYKKDKTNYEYVRELGGRPSTPLFRNITYTFERLWYGDTVIGETEYRELSPVFSQFIDQLRKGQHG